MFTTAATRLMAVLAVSLAVSAAVPAVSGAAPNQSGGSPDDAALCDTLRDRLQRYHDLANDPRESRAVRAFYKTRAATTLLRAQQAGCDWAQSRRAAKRAPATRTTHLGTKTTVTAIKATQTGDQQHDQYCADVAKLVDETIAEGDQQLGLGNDAEAQAWWDLAEDFIDRATENGCRFTLFIKARARGLHAAPSVVATRS